MAFGGTKGAFFYWHIMVGTIGESGTMGHYLGALWGSGALLGHMVALRRGIFYWHIMGDTMGKGERSSMSAFTGALYRGILYWHTLWGH